MTDTDVPSMNSVALGYKQQFTQEKWQKILLFEYHFAKQWSQENEWLIGRKHSGKMELFSKV